MGSVLTIYKKKGETPLQVLSRLRKEKPELEKEILSYAGRLDPLAEGLMLVLIGDANKEREKYLGLDKTYVAEILFGVSTDTHDLLGLVNEIKEVLVDEKKFNEAASTFIGKFSQKYPAFSSKTVGGVQLHELSRNGKVVDIPEHEVSLNKMTVISQRKITAEDVLQNALFSIDLVSGDFRQEEIRNKWELLLKNKNIEFDLFEVELQVSSGFYVRQFANDLGEKLGIPALAYSIKRTMAGEWS
ncbi:MAG: tRNA pseudouridine55 synthase [Parcubacteria group bacterium LiPW_30]|nr:MAG: tRNA pseudouridine55 synthase [Parcubacteria group bacterium LiPW_30]